MSMQMRQLLGNPDSLTSEKRPPFELKVVDFLDAVSEDIMKNPQSQAVPGLRAFGFWCRRRHLHRIIFHMRKNITGVRKSLLLLKIITCRLFREKCLKKRKRFLRKNKRRGKPYPTNPLKNMLLLIIRNSRGRYTYGKLSESRKLFISWESAF